MEKKQKRKLPLSGDSLVDLEFKILVDTLELEISAIRMKKILRHPDNRRKELCGFLSGDEIYLGKHAHRQKRESLVATLIHELLHNSRPGLRERRIRQLEKKYFARFTDQQKRFLRRYIPKHDVKKEPSDAP